MILKIELENFYSIRDRIIIDFIAGNAKSAYTERLDANVMTTPNGKILKTIGLFGQNASGKSNIMKALAFCINLMNNSHLYSDTSRLDYAPYKFEGYPDKPSSFQIDFTIDGIEYEYSFSLLHGIILKEALFHSPKGRRAKVFERDESSPGPIYSFGKNIIAKPNDVIASTGRKNLFLSRASSMNRPLPQRICRYFKENIVLEPTAFDGFKMEHSFTEYKNLILAALALCDSDIIDIELDYERMDNLRRPVFTTYHKADSSIPFDMAKEESSGTNNLFRLLLTMLDVMDNGKLMLLDEFDNSLHTFLADFVINLIHASNDAQMIFTSHNTNLIDTKKLRKDQILFVNRKDNNHTEVYSLYDFKDFRETMDAEKGYLQGRFEAVPEIELDVDRIKQIRTKEV